MSPQKTAKRYSAIYGVNERTVKRWKSLPEGERPDLDDEAATRLWMEGRGAASYSTMVVARPQATGPQGLQAAIGRLREEEANSHAAYRAAIDAGDEAVTGKLLKEWHANLKSLREIEEANPAVEKENKNAVNLAELQQALTELFARHRQDLEALPRRVALELVSKDEVSIREIIGREVASLVEILFSCSYLTEGGGNGE